MGFKNGSVGGVPNIREYKIAILACLVIAVVAFVVEHAAL